MKDRIVILAGYGLAFLFMAACGASSARKAEATYAGELASCTAQAPTLPSSATVDERRRGWATYDACVAAVHKRWGITETATKGTSP